MPHTAVTVPRSANAAPITISAAQNQIPHDQLGRFYREESEAGRKYVLDWIAVLEPLRTIKGREKMWKVVAHRIGEKPGTVKKRFYQYLDGIKGECHPFWEALIDRSRFPRRGDRGLDARFLDFWLGLRESIKRVKDGGRQAHRVLLKRLAEWEADPLNASLVIPGYASPPPRVSRCEMSHQFVPAGWSYSNLINHKPSQVALVNVLIGPKAASNLLPKNLATRAGLAYREIVFTDDQDYDNELVSFYNSGEYMRPQGFNTLEYLTGEFQTYGIQLRRRDEETGARRGINQEFYVWTVIADLMEHGFRDDERGTRIIREHATAKGYAHKDGYGRSFDEEIAHATNYRVSMDFSGRFDAGMFAKMFFRGKGQARQASGNFRYKGPLESAFHRLRTASAGLLGQTSQNERLLGGEHREVWDGYSRRLFKHLKENVPSKDRELIWQLCRHPVHTWDEFVLAMRLIYQAVNTRRDHRLEGWGACGHIIPGFAVKNLAQPWEPPAIISRDQLAAMDEDARQYIMTIGKAHPIRLSPSEAAAMYRKTDRKVVRFGQELAVSLLPTEWAYPRRRGKDSGGVTVRNDGTLVIRDPERFGTDALVYLGVCHGVHRDDQFNLRPGSQYLVHVCPFRPETAFLLTLEGRYRGYLKLMPRPCANDVVARLQNQGMIEQYRADAVRDSERRQAPEIQRLRDVVDHNERVKSGEIRPTQAQLDAEADRQAEIHRHALAERGIVEVELEDEDRDTAFEPDTGHRPSETDDIYDRLFATDERID